MTLGLDAHDGPRRADKRSTWPAKPGVRGEETVSFGKHRGLSFKLVAFRDPGYVGSEAGPLHCSAARTAAALSFFTRTSMCLARLRKRKVFQMTQLASVPDNNLSVAESLKIP